MATQPGTTVTVSREQVLWATNVLENWTERERCDHDINRAMMILAAVSDTAFELQTRVNKLEAFVRSQHPGLLECDQDIETLLGWAGG